MGIVEKGFSRCKYADQDGVQPIKHGTRHVAPSHGEGRLSEPVSQFLSHGYFKEKEGNLFGIRH